MTPTPRSNSGYSVIFHSKGDGNLLGIARKETGGISIYFGPVEGEPFLGNIPNMSIAEQIILAGPEKAHELLAQLLAKATTAHS